MDRNLTKVQSIQDSFPFLIIAPYMHLNTIVPFTAVMVALFMEEVVHIPRPVVLIHQLEVLIHQLEVLIFQPAVLMELQVVLTQLLVVATLVPLMVATVLTAVRAMVLFCLS